MIYIIIYTIFIFILISLLFILKKQINKLFSFVVYNINYYNYKYLNVIFINKWNIHEYDDSIKILMLNKINFLKNWKFNISNYYEYYNLFLKDIDYLDKLLIWKDIFAKNNFKNLKTVFDVLFKITFIYNVVRFLFMFFTVWIWFFLPYKKKY